MKLILCRECHDVVSLRTRHRTCECGKSSGQYLSDEVHAVISGPAIALGFNNRMLADAIVNQPTTGRMGETFEAFVIPLKCDTVEKR